MPETGPSVLPSAGEAGRHAADAESNTEGGREHQKAAEVTTCNCEASESILEVRFALLGELHVKAGDSVKCDCAGMPACVK